jgi:hypothetical protein
MDQMRAGGVAHPDVTYTNIVTQFDELVIPYTSGLMDPGPNVTNHVIQQHCLTDLAEHLTVAFDPVATTLVLNALTPQHPRPVPCTVVLSGIGAPGYPAPEPLDSDGDGNPDFEDGTPISSGRASAVAPASAAQPRRACSKSKRKAKPKRKCKRKRKRKR